MTRKPGLIGLHLFDLLLKVFDQILIALELASLGRLVTPDSVDLSLKPSETSRVRVRACCLYRAISSHRDDDQ
jgi:hypothetical protein